MNKSILKKCISMLLSILILLGMVPLQVFSAENTGDETRQELPDMIQASWSNPYYDIQIDHPELPEGRPYALPRDLTYHATAASAAKDVRAAMVSRSETIEIGYLFPIDEFTDYGLGEIGEALFDAACDHTGVPTEGDYLRWNCGGWSISGYATGYNSDETCYTTVLTFIPVYLTTEKQETVVTDKVSALLKSLSPSGTDYNKLKTVYDWICTNIYYDYDNLNDISYKLKYSTYAAIVHKTAVCQGYASLLYRLALEMGIDCRVISGIGNGDRHGWNIAQLEGNYYNLDSTWDAEWKHAGLDYAFFLKCDDNFEDHTRDQVYSTDKFYKNYPMGKEDYKPSANQMTSPVIKASNVASTGKPKISWSKVSGAAKYEVYRATSENGKYTRLSTVTGTSLTNSSAETGKIYYYKVRSVSANGDRSSWSNIVSRTCDLPNPTVTISTIASSGKIKLTWDKIDGAEKYEVHRATSEDGSYSRLITVTETTVTNKSISAGQTYYYKVKAIHKKSAANSDFSAVVSKTCALPKPAATISNVSSSGKIKLSWDKIDGAEKYEIYRATSKNGTYSELSTVTGTSFTNTSTTAGKTYYYKVKAIHDNSSANSALSAVVSRTCDLPSPTVKVSNVASSGKIKLTWDKIDGAEEYQIYRATSKDGTYSKLSTVTGTSFTNTSVTAGKTYYYKVKAIHDNSSANSAFSAVVSRTCDLPKPKLTVTRNSTGKPKLSWEEIDGATEYEVYRSTDSENWSLLKTTSKVSFTNSSAKAGTTYYYRIRAVHSNSSANSAYSSSKSITSK